MHTDALTKTRVIGAVLTVGLQVFSAEQQEAGDAPSLQLAQDSVQLGAAELGSRLGGGPHRVKHSCELRLFEGEQISWPVCLGSTQGSGFRRVAELERSGDPHALEVFLMVQAGYCPEVRGLYRPTSPFSDRSSCHI